MCKRSDQIIPLNPCKKEAVHICRSRIDNIANVRILLDKQLMADENLNWLMNWYVRECNNDWEHSYGVKIDTLDNPGWTIEIDLRETSLEGRSFESKHG